MSWFNPNPPRSPHRTSSYSHNDSHHDTRSQSSRHPSSSSKGYYYRTTSHSGSSRARPRSGYINDLLHKIKRYLQRLISYARRHPVKLLMMLLPLLTGGALAGILAKFGIRLPRGLEDMMGAGRRRSGMSGSGSGFGGAGGVQGLMRIAQQLM